MNLAPIVLFVYNRPYHTRETLEALSANHLSSKSQLIIFSDGPKENCTSEDMEKIVEVRNITKEKKWCRKVDIIEYPGNKGLASSIIEGVTKIVNQFGKIIVLEDDLLTSPWFLTYMNDALEMYKDVQNVFSVNAYMFPIETAKNETVLLPYTSTWGWGTWQDKWNAFEINPSENQLIAQNPFLKARFNLADYDYASMLIQAKHSWGIHWYFSVFKHNGLGVFPTQSLVHNIGFDGSGINCGTNEVISNITLKKIKSEYSKSIDLHFYSQYLNYFKHESKKVNILTHLLRKISISK